MTPGGAPIALLTHSGDYYTIDRVAAALARRGARPVRIDTDRFPAALSLTVRQRRGAAQPEVWLDDGVEAIDLARVPAVWSRRLWPARGLEAVERRHRVHCERTARAAFFQALELADGAYWVNPPAAGLAAESKLLQLRAAAALGFRVPETILTNAPEPVRDLHARTEGRVITKLLTPLSQTMEASGDFVYTSALTEADLAALEGLRWAPQLFQPLLEKREELRVTVVGRRIFAAAMRAPAEARARVDWRLARPGEGFTWEERRLAEPLIARVHALMDRLELRFAALDLIDDGAGEPAFLEVNPAGEWGWLERDLGFPISEAIAELLLRGGGLSP